MNTKSTVLQELLMNRGVYLSGEHLAETLHIGRSSVWKAIRLLRSEGYEIEAVTNKGYMLTGGDVVSREGIRQWLRHKEADILAFDTVSSTNDLARQLAEEGRPEGTVVVAGEQTAGRGRRGRVFYSPSDTGLYLSMVLRPQKSISDALTITTAAAVAVAETIEEITGKRPEIKWVNDILLGGKKVCGILTEGVLDMESSHLKYAVLGIGINVREPESGFPSELQEIAAAICHSTGQHGDNELRNRIAASVVDRFLEHYGSPDDEKTFRYYKDHLAWLGKEINVIAGEKIISTARIVDLNRDYSLKVEYEDGRVAALSSGEISIRKRYQQ